MPVRESPAQPAPATQHKMPPVDGPEPYPAEKARGGEIVLRTPTRRAIFIGGLAGLFLLVLLLRMIA
jgi:hypothetical protein